MSKLKELRRLHGRSVAQSLDEPITVFDYWHLHDAFTVLGITLVFGVILYQWSLTFFLLLVVTGIVPAIRKKNPRGIFLHWPYRYFGVNLPGIINPGFKRTFSD